MARPRNPATPSAPAEQHSDEDDVLMAKKKARKARRKAHNALPEAGELNITAMMDMLTIILVFLLKNYTTTPAANLTAGLNPPVSNSTFPMAEAITVSITRNDISVDDKKVVDLQNGKALEKDMGVAQQPLLIAPLRDALLARVEYHKKIEERGGLPFSGNMLVVGDRSIDYQLLSEVLYSAGQAQLANFKFVTLAP
jgi:biopolymer transport protein ExbD